MPAGELFTAADRHAIARAVRNAERACGYDFSVCVATTEGDSRAYAEAMHAQLDEPARSVLVLIDPVARRLEIVTGAKVRRTLDDAEVGLAALAMQTAFAAGDFVGGITAGVQQLGEHARRPTVHHAEGR